MNIGIIEVELPKNCYQCEFVDDSMCGHYCGFPGVTRCVEEFCNKRPQFCPIKPKEDKNND